MNKKFTSVAFWPAGVTYDEYGRSQSRDYHDTLNQAREVCWLLRREGYGGYGFSFPEKLMVLVKKQYTALAVSIDTRSEEQIQAADEVKERRRTEARGVLATMMYYAAPAVELYASLHSPQPAILNDSRIHKSAKSKYK